MVRRDVGELQAGEWRRDGDRVELACPCCGAVTYMASEHQVDADGYVSSLWLCEATDCPMVGAWLLLEGLVSDMNASTTAKPIRNV